MPNSEHSFSEEKLKRLGALCDSHFHIFGSPETYAYVKDLRYAPVVATPQDYMKFADKMGVKRMVLVQPSCFGYDNTCQLDAAKFFGLENCRVVVDINEQTTSEELLKLHEGGARGVRINVNPVQPLASGLVEKVLDRIEFTAARCREMSWSIDFLFPDWLSTEMIPYLDKLRVPFTIAHMGMNKACHGVESRGFQKLVNLAGNGEGYCWIKLTAPYRISIGDQHSDIIPMIQTVTEAAPDRVIWGSDYPHASFERYNTLSSLQLLQKAVSDESLLKRVLVENPSKLYGFDAFKCCP